jgi:putative ATPase
MGLKMAPIVPPVKPTPLAAELRPQKLDEVIGQRHLLADGMVIRQMAVKKRAQSSILWGPPGTGKTSLIRALSKELDVLFFQVNATSATVKELRAIIAMAKPVPRPPFVFIDEIHRFSKAQQDVLLPVVEDGTIVLFGATTEKAQFAVNSTLLSRCIVIETMPLNAQEMIDLFKRVKAYYKAKDRPVKIDQEAAKRLITRCSGDARKAITALETCVEILSNDRHVTVETVDQAIPSKHVVFDAHGNEHFDLAHAYQEAIQNSDTDGAVYWLGKWIISGEDPAFICRRMLITAFEDCSGNPSAWLAAMAASYTAERTGLPECMIPMSLATIEMAKSKRNKTAYLAIKRVMEDLENREVVHVPPGLRAGTSGYIHAVTRKYVKEWKKDTETAQKRPDCIGDDPDLTLYAIGRKEGPNSYAMHHGPHPDINEMLEVVGDDNDFIVEFYPHNGEQLNREYAQWVDGKWEEMWED